MPFQLFAPDEISITARAHSCSWRDSVSAARMRIISWNCGVGFHRKIEALLALSPDVAVVQECADLDSLARKAPEFAPTSAQWIGDNLYKGLGVFSFGPYRLSPVGAADASITYAIPAHVVGPSAFNLVALWSHYGKSRVSVAEPGPTMRALRAYASFLAKRPSIMAGDLNNHVRWDKRGKTSNHANAVANSQRSVWLLPTTPSTVLLKARKDIPRSTDAIAPIPVRPSTSIMS